MKAFISYSWDDESHKDWVKRFADTLVENGIEVILDQYDLKIGDDRFEFIEKSVRTADFVLCMCTPSYVNKANQREKGVGEETRLITPRFYKEHNSKQFIPILRKSESNISFTPDYMGGLIFVDFRGDSNFTIQMEELLRHLYGKPNKPKPTLGEIPNFEKPIQVISQKDYSNPSELYIQMKKIYKFGMNDPKYLINFGRLCFYLKKDDDAKEAFKRVLQLDNEFISFPDLIEKVKVLSREKKPFAMDLDSRRSLAYLGLISDDEDDILNSSYGTDDPEILILAGKYYLDTYEADIPTAITYFINATKNESVDSTWVKESDSAIYDILHEKKVIYPKMSWDYILTYVAKWNEHKLSLM